MRDCIRDEEAVRYLLDFCVELYKKSNRLVVEAGADLVSIADPTASGDMVSKRVFARLVLPY